MDQEREDYVDLDNTPAAAMSLRRLAFVFLIIFLVVGAAIGGCWFGVLLPGVDC